MNIQHFLANNLLPYREESRNGKDFLVVNGVPLVEGVLNGRYVSAEEFGAFVKDWDGIPVVIRHPKKNNGSARVPEPDVKIVGRFYNAKIDKKGGRLVGEYWLDKELMSNDPDGESILSKVYGNKPIETSTGYFSASYNESGDWNGKKYSLIDKNLHPDHIALLPDELGACSVKDGCGMNRNQANLNCNSCEHNPNVMFVNVTGSLPAEGKRLWEKVYNENKDEYGEETAAKMAWGACKKAGWRKEGDEWMKINQNMPKAEMQKRLDEMEAQMENETDPEERKRMKAEMDSIRKKMMGASEMSSKPMMNSSDAEALAALFLVANSKKL